MIVNAIEFNKEWEALALLGVTPRVTISPDCLVTFPQDMLLNQMLETLRSGGRHGSCGLGIGETMERAERYHNAFRMRDFRHAGGHWPTIRSRMHSVYENRLSALGLTHDEMPVEYRDFVKDAVVFAKYIGEAEIMMSRCTLVPDAEVNTGQPIIFEAAQGLALDRDMGFFPYVTRSKTGLFNIAALCREMNITEIEAVYVMRCYTTRHGAGPLDGEQYSGKLGMVIHDKTNQPNEWQGKLRFAPLDLWLAERLIELDYAGANTKGLHVWRGVALTCLDQAGAVVSYFDTDRTHQSEKRDVLWERVLQRIGADMLWTSHGPTRDTIEKVF
jgi:adenylosuccinate synthase